MAYRATTDVNDLAVNGAVLGSLIYFDGTEWTPTTSALLDDSTDTLSFNGDTSLYRFAANTLRTPGYMRVDLDAQIEGNVVAFGTDSKLLLQSQDNLSNVVYDTRQAGDIAARHQMLADGTISWGDGTNPVDVDLYRSSLGELTTNGSHNFNGSIQVTGFIVGSGSDSNLSLQNQDNATNPTYLARVAGDSQDRHSMRADGLMKWGDGTNPLDTNLYRLGSDLLGTDDAFYVGQYLQVTGDAYICTSSLDTLSFFGAGGSSQVSAYTVTNVTPDKSYDANATTVDELADVLGTLIADLQSYGLLDT